MTPARHSAPDRRIAPLLATLVAAAGFALTPAPAAPVQPAPSAPAAERRVGSPVFEDIPALMDAALARADAAIAEIIAVPQDQRTFDNTLGALDDALSQLDAETNMAQFVAFVSTDADERAASQEAQRRWDAWTIDLGKNEDLYLAIKAFAATDPQLAPNRRRLLEHTLRDYRRAGMELAPEQREALKLIEKQLSELSIEFQQNVRDDETVVALTHEELQGMPEDYLATLERSGELYIVTLDYPTVLPLWRQCDVEATRERVRFHYARRGGKKNVDLLEKIIALRNQRAQMLGYETTADFQIETRMARTPQTVRDFYERLLPLVRRKAEEDYARLLDAKREHTGDPEAVVHVWDNRYYGDRILREQYDVDQEQIRQYFPLESVLDGLFEITQHLYGLEYRDATASAGTTDRPLWHEDVRLFEVYDTATGEMLGEFYLDLFPRPNKYGHAAQWGLIQHKIYIDGAEQKPLAALVCNFTKPTADKPSLMTHDEVETFFHEFGHCLHTILSETELAAFGGTNVERDFVEAPSQMFENWVWDADVLQTFARHYETAEPIPADLVARMVAARHFNSGLDALGQIWLGSIDLAYHTDPDGVVDTTAVQFDLYDEIMLFPKQPNTYFHAAFQHLMGYHAGYYGYLWSLVYASDMFQRFKELGMLDPGAGKYYRDKILSRGGSVDGIDMVRDYLGREPDLTAFLKHLGLEEQ